MWHKHEWEYWGSQRLEFPENQGNKTFMVTVRLCDCGRWSADISDMQPYLDMKEYHVGG